MKRRTFFQTAAGTAVGAALTGGALAQGRPEALPQKPFQLKFAPHPRMFRHSAGESVVDQIQFASDAGFRAWEDNGLKKRPVSEQNAIGKKLADNTMEMGVFVAHGSLGKLTFAKDAPDAWSAVLQDIRDSVEVAKRVNAKWMTVVPGNVDEDKRGRLAPGYQMANAIELLRRCSDILEPHGLVMVLEPLNWYANHGGAYLRYADQAYAICKAVQSPSCKILFDIYHQQITEGNLIPNIDQSWSEIGYFQAGDNPGRKEPGTGEINFKNVFKHIHSKSEDFIVGMEHGASIPGVEGERAVIRAYHEVNQF